MKWIAGLAVLLAGCQLSTSTSDHTFATGGDSGASTPTTMPDLFQMTRPEAEAALRRAGITATLDIDDHGLCGSVVEHHVIELGHICSQTPGAGIRHGSRLPVTVRIQTENPWRGELTGGRRWFLLPETVGLTVAQARDKLRAAGYSALDRFQVSYVDEAGCKPNIVCRMYPEAMTRSDTTSDKVIFAGRAPEPPRPSIQAPKGDQPPAAPPQTKKLDDLF